MCEIPTIAVLRTDTSAGQQRWMRRMTLPVEVRAAGARSDAAHDLLMIWPGTWMHVQARYVAAVEPYRSDGAVIAYLGSWVDHNDLMDLPVTLPAAGWRVVGPAAGDDAARCDELGLPLDYRGQPMPLP
jgi:hypothetical protein